MKLRNPATLHGPIEMSEAFLRLLLGRFNTVRSDSPLLRSTSCRYKHIRARADRDTGHPIIQYDKPNLKCHQPRCRFSEEVSATESQASSGLAISEQDGNKARHMVPNITFNRARGPDKEIRCSWTLGRLEPKALAKMIYSKHRNKTVFFIQA